MALGIEKDLERRRKILAAARQLIAERGYDGVSMSEIAAGCGVTVPTLYKRFGNKHRLLAAAVQELFRWQLEGASVPEGSQGLARLSAIIENLASEVNRQADYVRGLILVLGRSQSTGHMDPKLPVAMLSQPLYEMQERNQLVDWIDLQRVAECLSSQLMEVTLRWAAEERGESWLRSRMLFGVYLMLAGIVQGDAQTELEDRLREMSKARDAA